MEETVIKNITAEDFLALDKIGVTILDIREKDDVLISPIEGAVNIPFSEISSGLSALDKETPVYVICKTGELSEEVTVILADRGYDAYNLIGGHNALSKCVKNSPPVELDLRGICCPGPVVRIAETLKTMQDGQRVRIISDEAAFSYDIAVWCESTGNTLVSLENNSGEINAFIEKSRPKKSSEKRPNCKTFVLFSGDLDKTIAAFIMANAAASMGREVTLFFTFWGAEYTAPPQKGECKKKLHRENVRGDDAQRNKKAWAFENEHGWNGR